MVNTAEIIKMLRLYSVRGKFLAISLFLILFSNLLYPQNIAKLNEELSDLKDDASKVNLMNSLAKEWLIEDIDSSLYFANKALLLSKQLNDNELIVKSLITLTHTFRQAGLYEQGIETIYNQLSDNSITRTPGLKANLLLSLGELNNASSQFEEAIKNSKEALNIFKILEDKEGLAEAHNRLAINFFKIKKFFISTSHADTSIMLAKNLSNEILLASNYEILGGVYNYMNEFDKALLYFDKALEIAETKNNISSETHILTNKAITYFLMDDPSSCIEYGRKAYQLASKTKNKGQIEQSSHYLSKAYAQLNNYKLAFFYAEIAEEVRIDIFNVEHDQQISKMNRKYQYETQKQELQGQRFELEMKENELRRKQLLNFLLISWIVILFVLFGFLNASQRKLRRINTILANKNSLIEEQNRKIEEQVHKYKNAYKKLKDLDQYKEAMTHMLVHDLKNPLNVLINLPELGEFEEKDEIILHTSKQMLTLVMNMLDIQKFENNRMELNRMLVPVSKVLKNALEDVIFSAKHKHITFNTSFDIDYFLYIDRSLVVRIFVNLYTNAIKYSPAGSIIDVSLEETDNQKVLIKIKDNGVGIDKANLDRIFEKYFHIENNSNDASRSTGLGLTFCKMAVEAHDCEIGVESEKNKGATFWFTLPFRLKK
ncbi:MAG: tetratricopeptide repeat-containing sensor histidine kinase [Bacteroidales bacterium]|nr:tetratricopeptide repeat-containing sensor histidine kinase [Bacteroidales bacterium]MCF8403732.1 tetratricopeptide repeat-containing sensor histidine kinase [Bacteroidales bacterium]